METPVSSTPGEMLRAIKILFYTLIAGMIMFTVIVFALNFLQEPSLTDKSVARILFTAVLFIAAASLTAAANLYKKRITAAQSFGLPLVEKLNIYRAALIVYLALCEGAGLFAVIVYFLTGNKLLLAVIALVLLAMLLKRPEKQRIFNELQLDSKEQMELN